MHKLIIWLLSASCFGADLYFATAAAGSANGTNCANAYAYNDAINGIDGTGTASWVAGNTLHLCGGTWSGANAQQWVHSHGAGAAGNLITIKFETGTVLSAPYHSVNGAIGISAAYITVDGGVNGIIQNTANGTATSPNCINGSCSTQQASILVRFNVGGDNGEVKNLTLAGAYVHDSTTNPDDANGETSYCVYALGNPGMNIHNNTCHDAQYGFTLWGTGVIISHNLVYNTAWSMASGIASPVTGLQIDNNSFVTNCQWATTGNHYHLNNIHLFSNSGTGNYSGVVIYGNYLGGGCSTNQTAHLYAEGSFTSPQIFNNFFDNVTGGPFFFNGVELYTSTGGGGWHISDPVIVNNTFLGTDYTTSAASGLSYNTGAIGEMSGLIWKNNLVIGGKTMVSAGVGHSDATDFASGGMNYNAYDNTNSGAGKNPFSYNGAAYTTFAGYAAALPVASGQEANSFTDTPAHMAVNSNGTLASTSVARGVGVNLTSLGITALNSDKAGVARPSSGAWDSGAYQYVPPATGSVMFGTFKGAAK